MYIFHFPGLFYAWTPPTCPSNTYEFSKSISFSLWTDIKFTETQSGDDLGKGTPPSNRYFWYKYQLVLSVPQSLIEQIVPINSIIWFPTNSYRIWTFPQTLIKVLSCRKLLIFSKNIPALRPHAEADLDMRQNLWSESCTFTYFNR